MSQSDVTICHLMLLYVSRYLYLLLDVAILVEPRFIWGNIHQSWSIWINPGQSGPIRANQSDMSHLSHMYYLSKFPLTPMGVLATGSAHARPSARPAST